MREEIVQFLREQDYIEISKKNGAPFPIFYKQRGQQIEAIAVIDKEVDLERDGQLLSSVIKNLQYSLEQQLEKTVSLVTWIVLQKEPQEGEREFASKMSQIWFINEQERKVYVFDEFSKLHSTLYKKLEAFLSEDIGQLRKINYEERKKQRKEETQVFLERVTPVNTVLVLSNSFLFLFLYLYGVEGAYLFSKGVLDWEALFWDGEYYRLITSMFLHFDFYHLCNNMIFLFLIGSYLEKIIGGIKYFFLYFISGILSGIVSALFHWFQNANVVSAGASGALFGVVGALFYIIIRKKGRLEEMNFWSFFIMIIGTLSVGFVSSDVDNAAHLGGLFAGFIIGIFFYRNHKGEIGQKK